MQPHVAQPHVQAPHAWPHLLLLIGGLCLACIFDIICSAHLSSWVSISSLKASMHALVHSSEGSRSSNSHPSEEIDAFTAENFKMDGSAYAVAAHTAERQLLWRSSEASHTGWLPLF